MLVPATFLTVAGNFYVLFTR